MEHFVLSLKERMYMLQVLPARGAYSELCLSKSIVDLIKVTKEEDEKLLIKKPEGIEITPEADLMEFKFNFSKEQFELIKATLSKLEAVGQLNIGNMTLYKKFVMDTGAECEDKTIKKLEQKQKDEPEAPLAAAVPA